MNENEADSNLVTKAVKEFLKKFRPNDTVFNSVANEGSNGQLLYDYAKLDGTSRIFRSFPLTDTVKVYDVNGAPGVRSMWKINNVTDKIPTK